VLVEEEKYGGLEAIKHFRVNWGLHNKVRTVAVSIHCNDNFSDGKKEHK